MKVNSSSSLKGLEGLADLPTQMGRANLIRLMFFWGLVLTARCSFAGGVCIDSLPLTGAQTDLFHFSQKTDEQYRQGKMLLTPFLVPGYSPDIQFTLTAGCIFSFKTRKGDSLLPRSTIPVTLTYSSSGAIIASSSWVTFWVHDRFRLNSLFQFKALHDVYFGVGYADAVHASYPDSTGYHRSYLVLQLKPIWRIAKDLFAGISLDYNQNILWDVNRHMSGDKNYKEFGQTIVNSGIGAAVSYDSRDFPQNSHTGFFTSATYTFYSKVAGGNTSFGALDCDSRLFVPLATRKVRTIALNWRSRYEFGFTPFTYMASFGSPFDLRGYRYGQFRDQCMNYGIVEYRQNIYTNAGKPTRFGFVVWTGAGAIGNNVDESLFHQVLPNAGIGLRFEIQPRLNLRLDLGYSPSHTGVYFNFLEAY